MSKHVAPDDVHLCMWHFVNRFSPFNLAGIDSNKACLQPNISLIKRSHVKPAKKKVEQVPLLEPTSQNMTNLFSVFYRKSVSQIRHTNESLSHTKPKTLQLLIFLPCVASMKLLHLKQTFHWPVFYNHLKNKTAFASTVSILTHFV